MTIENQSSLPHRLLAEEFDCGITALSHAGGRLRKSIKQDDLLQKRLKEVMNEIRMCKCRS